MSDVEGKFNELIKKAASYIQEEKITEAIETWEEALKIDPENTELKHNLCVAYYNLAVKWLTFSKFGPSYHNAYSQIMEAVKYDPDDVDAQTMREDLEEKLRGTSYEYLIDEYS